MKFVIASDLHGDARCTEKLISEFHRLNADKLLLLGNFSGGEVFRSGCLYERGNGKIFYFQPGHETFPTYHVPEVQTIIGNAVHFLAPDYREKNICPEVNLIDSGEKYLKKSVSLY